MIIKDVINAISHTDIVDASKNEIPENRCPTIFVHGFLGWGEKDKINELIPYWGLSNGDVISYLNKWGYNCKAASVGSLSSAWDRACELYAQLVGGTVDYGAYHSGKNKHARYGITYDKPLVENWDEQNPIDIVAHSFGGATARLFIDILENGRPEEVDASGNCSPFFKGGKGKYVRSLSCMASPHNGTTAIYTENNLSNSLTAMMSVYSRILGISDFKDIYDFQLDQFGIKRVEGERIVDTLKRMMAAEFLSTDDHALHDLAVDEAIELNKQAKANKDIYYFSYPSCKTQPSLLSYNQVPEKSMTPIMKKFSLSMGRYRGKSPKGKDMDKGWFPNDGIVNTISSMYPICDQFKICSGNEFDYAPGIWNVMPITRLDHLAMIGGVFNANPSDIKKLYLKVMRNIDLTYKN